MRKILLISLILLMSSFVYAKDDDGSTWTKVGKNSYIDYSSVVGLEDFYGFSILLKSYNKGQYEPVNGKPISYTLGQYKINCLKQTYQIGMLDSYDKNDNFVNGDYNKYSEFRPIIEDTTISEVAKYLCRY